MTEKLRRRFSSRQMARLGSFVALWFAPWHISGFVLSPTTNANVVNNPPRIGTLALVAKVTIAHEGMVQNMSRSERKSLERTRKGRQRVKGSAAATDRKIHRILVPKVPLPLLSSAVCVLTSDASADDVMRAIKRAQNNRDARDLANICGFLLDYTDESYAYGYKGSLLARLAVAALHIPDQQQLAARALQARRVEYRHGMKPFESAAIIRGLLRVHNVSDALEMLDDELSLPLDGTPLDSPNNKERLKYRALALASIASRHFFELEPIMAVRACCRLAEIGPMVRRAGLQSHEIAMPWLRLLKGASECEKQLRLGNPVLLENVNSEAIQASLPCNLVYSVLNSMTTFPTENNDRIYEVLSNALVRRVVFVTGAIDMKGCPPPSRGEAAFIGRSNVGKSSLVNMVTNRKSLAYTSKRPGKTQQFNFFVVNDKPDLEKEIRYGDDIPGERDRDSFYIVDLPGFGYAEVSAEQRRSWSAFMNDYISNRKSLKVLFHLVDARHGATEEDGLIMKQVSTSLPPSAKYVIVITKADKNSKGSKSGYVAPAIMTQVRHAMKSNGVASRPVILTSSETRLGRDDIWRYLKLAADGRS